MNEPYGRVAVVTLMPPMKSGAEVIAREGDKRARAGRMS